MTSIISGRLLSILFVFHSPGRFRCQLKIQMDVRLCYYIKNEADGARPANTWTESTVDPNANANILLQRSSSWCPLYLYSALQHHWKRVLSVAFLTLNVYDLAIQTPVRDSSRSIPLRVFLNTFEPNRRYQIPWSGFELSSRAGYT